MFRTIFTVEALFDWEQVQQALPAQVIILVLEPIDYLLDVKIPIWSDWVWCWLSERLHLVPVQKASEAKVHLGSRSQPAALSFLLQGQEKWLHVRKKKWTILGLLNFSGWTFQRNTGSGRLRWGGTSRRSWTTSCSAEALTRAVHPPRTEHCSHYFSPPSLTSTDQLNVVFNQISNIVNFICGIYWHHSLLLKLLTKS